MVNYLLTSEKNECCGCGACEQKCLQKAITMRKDKNGFLYPYIEKDKCSNCLVCHNVCPFMDAGYIYNQVVKIPEVYLASHEDDEILKRSTSGGAFSAIAEVFCDNKYAIFGAAFDENLVVQHKYINNIRELCKFRGSKYVQSVIGKCYNHAEVLLKDGKKVLFSGTPCQIAGLRSYLNKEYENLLCVDLICHGVPSPLMLKKYISYLENKSGKKVEYISFRDKSKYGWLIPCTRIDFVSSERAEFHLADDDPYEKISLSNIALRESCYSCKFAKSKRVGDLTIGDFWGAETLYPKIDYRKGLSLILVNTVKGRHIFEQIRCFTLCKKTDISSASAMNKNLLYPTVKHKKYYAFYKDLKNLEFNILAKKYFLSRPFYIRVLSVLLKPKTKRWIKKFLRIKK